MPYHWSTAPNTTVQELTLWPHQSLPPRGLAAFVLATFTLICLPLFGLLGTKLLWGLLPFLMIAVGGIWWGLSRSQSDRSVVEVLRLSSTELSLTRHNPRSQDQTWTCNTYWAQPTIHPTGGPVPNYVTLSGNGREVEIGAFLSEEERMALYSELQTELSNSRAPH